MNIRLSQFSDLTDLMEIFHQAQATIGQLGIDQWQNGYPSEKVVADDMTQNRSYVVQREGELLGTFVLVQTEPTYDRIYEGQWQCGDAYLAIHRVAVKVAARGTGVADAIIRYAERQAKAMELQSLRIDTHRGNLPMRRMLEKQGFQCCGVIYLRDGAHRVAYEKRVP
jgi:GNAT superfamily N-acetyltransferase